MKTTLVLSLNPHNNGNMCGAFPGRPSLIPGNSGEWFISVSRPVGGREDTIFERHVNGVYADECRLYNSGHTTASGALGARNEIWTKLGKDVVRFDYRPGRVTVRDVKHVNTFSAGRSVELTFSPTRQYAVIRTRASGAGFFTRRKVSDMLADRDRRLGKVIRVPIHSFSQSFGLVQDRLYAVFGASTDHKDAKTNLQEWSFTTGDKLGQYDITRLGNDAVSGKYEAEFAPGRYVLSKVGSGSKRRLLVYSHDLIPPVLSLPRIVQPADPTDA